MGRQAKKKGLNKAPGWTLQCSPGTMKRMVEATPHYRYECFNLWVPSTKMLPELTTQELFRLVFLMSYADKQGSLKRPKVPCEQNTSLMNTVLKKCVDLGIMEQNNKTYTLSEYVGGRKFLERDSYGYKRAKNETQWRINTAMVRWLYFLSKPSRDHEHIGRYFQLLPYCNHTYNVLCKNPDCEDIDFIEPLRPTEIADIIGVIHSHITRVLDPLAYSRELPSGYFVLGQWAELLPGRKAFYLGPELAHTQQTNKGLYAIGGRVDMPLVYWAL